MLEDSKTLDLALGGITSWTGTVCNTPANELLRDEVGTGHTEEVGTHVVGHQGDGRALAEGNEAREQENEDAGKP